MDKESPIGQRIYDLRIERDIQQGELANAVGLHQSVLNRIEKGSRPARDIEIAAIASFLQVSSDYLLGLPPVQQEAQALPAQEKNSTFQNDLNLHEQNLVQIFRQLDNRGQHTVLDTLQREYDYVKPQEKMPDYSFSHTAKIKLSTCTYKLIISTKIAYRVNCSGPIKSNLSGLLQIDTLFQYIFYNIATAFLNSSNDIPALLAASILESIPSFTKLHRVLNIPSALPSTLPSASP